MKTLKEIDEQIVKESREAVDTLLSTPDTPIVLSEEDAFWLQQETRFGEKYRQMYAILEVLEQYLAMSSTDGRPERQPLRKQLKEMLEKI